MANVDEGRNKGRGRAAPAKPYQPPPQRSRERTAAPRTQRQREQTPIPQRHREQTRVPRTAQPGAGGAARAADTSRFRSNPTGAATQQQQAVQRYGAAQRAQRTNNRLAEVEARDLYAQQSRQAREAQRRYNYSGDADQDIGGTAAYNPRSTANKSYDQLSQQEIRNETAQANLERQRLADSLRGRSGWQMAKDAAGGVLGEMGNMANALGRATTGASDAILNTRARLRGEDTQLDLTRPRTAEHFAQGIEQGRNLVQGGLDLVGRAAGIKNGSAVASVIYDIQKEDAARRRQQMMNSQNPAVRGFGYGAEMVSGMAEPFEQSLRNTTLEQTRRNYTDVGGGGGFVAGMNARENVWRNDPGLDQISQIANPVNIGASILAPAAQAGRFGQTAKALGTAWTVTNDAIDPLGLALRGTSAAKGAAGKFKDNLQYAIDDWKFQNQAVGVTPGRKQRPRDTSGSTLPVQQRSYPPSRLGDVQLGRGSEPEFISSATPNSQVIDPRVLEEQARIDHMRRVGRDFSLNAGAQERRLPYDVQAPNVPQIGEVPNSRMLEGDVSQLPANISPERPYGPPAPARRGARVYDDEAGGTFSYDDPLNDVELPGRRFPRFDRRTQVDPSGPYRGAVQRHYNDTTQRDALNRYTDEYSDLGLSHDFNPLDENDLPSGPDYGQWKQGQDRTAADQWHANIAQKRGQPLRQADPSELFDETGRPLAHANMPPTGRVPRDSMFGGASQTVNKVYDQLEVEQQARWETYQSQLDALGVPFEDRVDQRGMADLQSPIYDQYFQDWEQEVEQLLQAPSGYSYDGLNQRQLAEAESTAYLSALRASGRYTPPIEMWEQFRGETPADVFRRVQEHGDRAITSSGRPQWTRRHRPDGGGYKNQFDWVDEESGEIHQEPRYPPGEAETVLNAQWREGFDTGNRTGQSRFQHVVDWSDPNGFQQVQGLPPELNDWSQRFRESQNLEQRYRGWDDLLNMQLDGRRTYPDGPQRGQRVIPDAYNQDYQERMARYDEMSNFMPDERFEAGQGANNYNPEEHLDDRSRADMFVPQAFSQLAEEHDAAYMLLSESFEDASNIFWNGPEMQRIDLSQLTPEQRNRYWNHQATRQMRMVMDMRQAQDDLAQQFGFAFDAEIDPRLHRYLDRIEQAMSNGQQQLAARLFAQLKPQHRQRLFSELYQSTKAAMREEPGSALPLRAPERGGYQSPEMQAMPGRAEAERRAQLVQEVGYNNLKRMLDQSIIDGNPDPDLAALLQGYHRDLAEQVQPPTRSQQIDYFRDKHREPLLPGEVMRRRERTFDQMSPRDVQSYGQVDNFGGRRYSMGAQNNWRTMTPAQRRMLSSQMAQDGTLGSALQSGHWNAKNQMLLPDGMDTPPIAGAEHAIPMDYSNWEQSVLDMVAGMQDPVAARELYQRSKGRIDHPMQTLIGQGGKGDEFDIPHLNAMIRNMEAAGRSGAMPQHLQRILMNDAYNAKASRGQYLDMVRELGNERRNNVEETISQVRPSLQDDAGRRLLDEPQRLEQVRQQLQQRPGGSVVGRALNRAAQAFDAAYVQPFKDRHKLGFANQAGGMADVIEPDMMETFKVRNEIEDALTALGIPAHEANAIASQFGSEHGSTAAADIAQWGASFGGPGAPDMAKNLNTMLQQHYQTAPLSGEQVFTPEQIRQQQEASRATREAQQAEQLRLSRENAARGQQQLDMSMSRDERQRLADAQRQLMQDLVGFTPGQKQQLIGNLRRQHGRDYSALTEALLDLSDSIAGSPANSPELLQAMNQAGVRRPDRAIRDAIRERDGGSRRGIMQHPLLRGAAIVGGVALGATHMYDTFVNKPQMTELMNRNLADDQEWRRFMTQQEEEKRENSRMTQASMNADQRYEQEKNELDPNQWDLLSDVSQAELERIYREAPDAETAEAQAEAYMRQQMGPMPDDWVKPELVSAAKAVRDAQNWYEEIRFAKDDTVYTLPDGTEMSAADMKREAEAAMWDAEDAQYYFARWYIENEAPGDKRGQQQLASRLGLSYEEILGYTPDYNQDDEVFYDQEYGSGSFALPADAVEGGGKVMPAPKLPPNRQRRAPANNVGTPPPPTNNPGRPSRPARPSASRPAASSGGAAGSQWRPYEEGGYAGRQAVNGQIVDYYYMNGQRVPETALSNATARSSAPSYQRGAGGGQRTGYPVDPVSGYAGGGIGPSGMYESRYEKNGQTIWESELQDYQRPQQAQSGQREANIDPISGYAGNGIGPSGDIESIWIMPDGTQVWESQVQRYQREELEQPRRERSFWDAPLEDESLYRRDPMTDEWYTWFDGNGDGVSEWIGSGSSSEGGGSGSSARRGGGYSTGSGYSRSSGGSSQPSVSSLSDLDNNTRDTLVRAVNGRTDWSDPRVVMALHATGLTVDDVLRMFNSTARWTTLPRQPAIPKYL